MYVCMYAPNENDNKTTTKDEGRLEIYRTIRNPDVVTLEEV